ncbi:hypothetical protein J8L98_13820 [Pseudoalteromonas sp. MMG013]|uniref:hypothetical protein n=1 Tax=Pseudoalteromonas sp. MMG013 TaxID=2822687 RepID=UPI001B388051|nr:hypothetical protein [Pseudoalteromonas sp. MMG013]MBQ4862769.1 hypothetical protein [Pseudoalteromonas sp. MMG013]
MTKSATFYIKHSFSVRLFFFIFSYSVLFTPSVTAHELHETNARVTLRDGHLEIRIWVDVARWTAKLQNSEAWLLGDIERIMPLKLNKKQQDTFLGEIITSQTSLILNNQAVTLKPVSISYPKTAPSHPKFKEFIVSAEHSLSSIHLLNIRFPKSLGVVHTNFIKPKYQMVPAGQNTQISFPPRKHKENK